METMLGLCLQKGNFEYNQPWLLKEGSARGRNLQTSHQKEAERLLLYNENIHLPLSSSRPCFPRHPGGKRASPLMT